MSNFKHKIIGSIGLTMSSQVVVEILRFGVMVILVRLLSPKDYGLNALVGTVLGFVQIFSTLGFSQALIQKQEVTYVDYSTAFWSTLLLSLLLYVAVVLLSPLAALYFDEPPLDALLKVAALGFIVSALGTLQLAELQKTLAFKKIIFIELLTAVFMGAVSIGLAMNGFGVWSLVLGSLASQALALPFLWKMSAWIPRLVFSKQSFSDIFAFGANLTIGGVINYFMRNLDNAIIGKVLGSTALGYYSLAYSLMLKPLQYVSSNVARVLFPALSHIKEDKEATRKVYLKSVHYISLITFPMMAGLFFVAPQAIEVVYGARWMPAVPALQILCLVGAIQSIGATVGTIYLSQGRADMALKVTMICAPIVICAFFIGVHWGIAGVAAAYAVAVSSIWAWSQKLANGLIDLKLAPFYRELAPAVLASTLMCVVLGSLMAVQVVIFNVSLAPHFQLMVMIPLGMVTYICALAWVCPDSLCDLRLLVSRKGRAA